MVQEHYLFRVDAGEGGDATGLTHNLADDLREVSGVLMSARRKDEISTMDLGSIVAVIATSGATLAMAQGVADWLRRRRGTTLKIERDSRSGSIKAAVENIDPATAVRIVEIVRGA